MFCFDYISAKRYTFSSKLKKLTLFLSTKVMFFLYSKLIVLKFIKAFFLSFVTYLLLNKKK